MSNLDALRIFHRIQLNQLQTKQALEIAEFPESEKNMPVSPALQPFITALDTASNNIAARIQRLVDKINAGTPLTADDATALQADVDKLTALGQDPANPVPTTV